MLWMVLTVLGLLLVVSFFTSQSKMSMRRARRRAGRYVGMTPPIGGDGGSDCGAGGDGGGD
jgi:hypothetical protein